MCAERRERGKEEEREGEKEREKERERVKYMENIKTGQSVLCGTSSFMMFQWVLNLLQEKRLSHPSVLLCW